ncbi:MAG: hypothetical protein ING25_11065 [Burkholderiales bacterium]|nr:hypothetical protein [Burkholderiales bacterium]
MADIFNFGGFLKKVNKDREEKAMPAEPTQKPSEESQPTMSQGDFSYGPEGYRRNKDKKK